jgi:hypothetical protein
MPTEDHPPVELEDAGCEAIPADLVELHEVLEWEQAVKAARGEPVDPIPGPPDDEAPGPSGVLGHDPSDL